MSEKTNLYRLAVKCCQSVAAGALGMAKYGKALAEEDFFGKSENSRFFTLIWGQGIFKYKC